MLLNWIYWLNLFVWSTDLWWEKSIFWKFFLQNKDVIARIKTCVFNTWQVVRIYLSICAGNPQFCVCFARKTIESWYVYSIWQRLLGAWYSTFILSITTNCYSFLVKIKKEEAFVLFSFILYFYQLQFKTYSTPYLRYTTIVFSQFVEKC